MRFVCFGIIGKSKMYTSEACISSDEQSLEDELKGAKEDEPDEDYKISPLYTLRHRKHRSSRRIPKVIEN